MILEIFIDMLCDLILGSLELLNFYALPVNALHLLASFAHYGNYVVGSDLLLIFSASVMMWITVKFSIGFILFLWRLLPFT